MNEKNLHVIYTCFPKGKHKVLTMSYDDGRVEDQRLVSIFNEYGIKGTFHINAGLFADRIPLSECARLYQGHEVSCHTYLHPTIARCPVEQVMQQILEDRRALEKVVGYPVRGLSYPNGSFSEEIVKYLPAAGIRYARTVTSTGSFAMPDNFLTWNATCHHNRNLLEYAQQFKELSKTQYLYMMYVWGHSYEFTQKDNWELMEEFCRSIGGRDDIWYASNIEIVDYMEAASRLQYSVSGEFVYNPSVQSVWVEIDKKIIEAKGGQITYLCDIGL